MTARRLPGSRTGQRGSVTAETAIALPALVVVLTAVLWLVAVGLALGVIAPTLAATSSGLAGPTALAISMSSTRCTTSISRGNAHRARRWHHTPAAYRSTTRVTDRKSRSLGL